MKTFYQSCCSLLESFAMSEDQINAVMEQMQNSEANKEMLGRWNDQVSGYPPIMENIMHRSCLQEALTWLEINKPQAWFIPAIKQCLN